MNCPTCSQPLFIRETAIRTGVRRFIAKCHHVKTLHAKSTIITGCGPDEESAAADYVEKVKANAERAERAAQIAAEKAAGTYVARVRKTGKRAILHPMLIAGEKPMCPSCRVPIVTRPTVSKGRNLFAAKCERGERVKNKCSLGIVYCIHDTPEGAISAWLFHVERLQKEDAKCNGPRCPRCGLRGDHECILPVEHYARTGASSSGIEWGRGESGDV